MNFFKRLTGGSTDETVPEETGGPEVGDLPIARFDHSSGKELTDQFRDLTQVQLEELDAYESSHKKRPDVLAKLRYLRSNEPISGYDELSPEKISEALVGADAETVKKVRDYERKFQRRKAVLDETARVLPQAPASARETKAQDEKDERVASKMRTSKIENAHK
jgi:hypothetical protein